MFSKNVTNNLIVGPAVCKGQESGEKRDKKGEKPLVNVGVHLLPSTSRRYLAADGGGGILDVGRRDELKR